MRFLADENFPRPAIVALRNAGFEVAWVTEDQPGVPDALLTFDKDFGELAFRRRLPADFGIVLFRLIHQSPEEVAAIALSAVRSCQPWVGYFSVVTRDRIRLRPLPARRGDP